jgi:hypothetical protein
MEPNGSSNPLNTGLQWLLRRRRMPPETSSGSEAFAGHQSSGRGNLRLKARKGHRLE